ncbi:MAG: PaaI family thioesterase [Acidimicrobiales bacterium]
MTDHTDLLHQSMPLCAHLGFRARTFTPAEVEIEVDWSPELCTSATLLHGGTVMALADSAGAALAFANLPDGASGTSTIESKTNFLGGVTGGVVRATARLLHAGSSTLVIETEVTNNDRLVAKTTQTQAVLRA